MSLNSKFFDASESEAQIELRSYELNHAIIEFSCFECNLWRTQYCSYIKPDVSDIKSTLKKVYEPKARPVSTETKKHRN